MKIARKKNKSFPQKWQILCQVFPPEDEPIVVKSYEKTYFGIRTIDENGDFVHCQDHENGGFVFSINLRSMFNDPSFKWRLFDD